MKVTVPNEYIPRRGAKVNPGGVYYKRQGNPFFRIVLAIVEQVRERPYNNVAMLHVDATGAVVGCSMQPDRYVQDHMDLIGIVENMPELKIIFNQTEAT